MVVKNEFRTTNQHDLVLCSNAWSCFSFRTTNQHDHVLRSNAWSYFSFRTTNQHDLVLRSNAWSCFSFRATNQHDHVLRSNAWSCFLFRHDAGWSRLCLWAGHFTQSCPVLIMYLFLFIVAFFSPFACGLTWCLH